MDSTLVLYYLRDSNLVPWRLRVAWSNCLHHISHMHFRSSHIFREGNQVADALANIGLSLTDMSWWDGPPPSIVDLCWRDALGLLNFRIC